MACSKETIEIIDDKKEIVTETTTSTLLEG
jgi:hypothetical protein